jgi:hypothetical protein
MKNVYLFVIRQSGWLSFFLFLFALERAKWVALGLWHGSGLKGYVDTGSGPVGDTPSLIPVWSALIEAVLLMAIALAFCFIAVRRKRSRQAI